MRPQLTRAQGDALKWLADHSGDGIFDNTGVLLAAGEVGAGRPAYMERAPRYRPCRVLQANRQGSRPAASDAGAGVTDYPEGVPVDVCRLFEKLALEVYREGLRKYSARSILYRIRWHHEIERGDRAFKCNDHWSPDLARWLIARRPEFAGFFELRERVEA